MSDVTRILSAIEQEDAQAPDKLLPLVYNELRKLAAARMANEASDHTLQATALVHEAYIRLVGAEQQQRWEGRGHFFAAAAEAMRRILVESARRKQSLKRGVHHHRVELDEACSLVKSPSDALLALDEALAKLEQQDSVKAELVKLRYFAGLSVQEAADALGISRATADRYWVYAKVWLYCEIDEPQEKHEA